MTKRPGSKANILTSWAHGVLLPGLLHLEKRETEIVNNEQESQKELMSASLPDVANCKVMARHNL